MKDLPLRPKAIEHEVVFGPVEELVMETKPDAAGRPFAMLVTRVKVRYRWKNGGWEADWSASGCKRLKSGEWSALIHGHLWDRRAEAPAWLTEAIERFRPAPLSPENAALAAPLPCCCEYVHNGVGYERAITFDDCYVHGIFGGEA